MENEQFSRWAIRPKGLPLAVLGGKHCFGCGARIHPRATYCQECYKAQAGRWDYEGSGHLPEVQSGSSAEFLETRRGGWSSVSY
jgi:hypothetical protein